MIFKETDDYKNNADVSSGSQYSNMWDKYAIAYKIGAETIAEKIASDKSNIDFLVYPLIFLYRQYFELRFKEILLTSRDYNNDQIVMRPIHDLNTIWLDCKKRIKLIRPDTDCKHLEGVEDILDGFNKYDQASFSFRYPDDKNGNPNLTPLNYIDIQYFLKSIAASVSFLESIKSLISATIDFKDL